MNPLNAAALVLCIFQGAQALNNNQTGWFEVWTACTAVNTFFGMAH